MASTVAVLVLLSACLFTVTVGYGDDCHSYYTSNSVYSSSISCGYYMHCCGTCDHRYCCPIDSMKLSDYDQSMCAVKNGSIAVIVSGVVGFVIFIVMIIVCCCCPCCCIYKMCKRPRPVVGTHITTVVNTQSIQQQQQPQQPVMHYPAYQPVPTQPGYGGQPMQTGPYQGQPYTPGPPPPYHTVASPGYPNPQAPYDGSQAMYPTQPPAQPGAAHLPSETFSQPAYNPAYMQPPKSAY